MFVIYHPFAIDINSSPNNARSTRSYTSAFHLAFLFLFIKSIVSEWVIDDEAIIK